MGLQKLPISLKYGRFVISPDGILNTDDFLPYYAGPMSTIIEIDNLSSGTYSLVISDGFCEIETNPLKPNKIITGIIIMTESIKLFFKT